MSIGAGVRERSVPRNSLKESILNLTAGEVIYLVGLTLYILSYILFETTPISGPTTVITMGVLIIVFLKVLLTSIEQKTRFISALAIVAIGLLTLLSAGATQFFMVVALMLGSKGVPPKRIAHVVFWAVAIGVTSVLLLCAAGYLPNSTFVDSMRTRHSLGFTYVGMFDLYVLHLALLLIYLKGNSIGKMTAAIFIMLHVFAFSQSVVRGTAIVAALVWVLYFVCIKWGVGKKGTKLAAAFAACSIPVCLLIAVYTAAYYQPGSELWSLINELFSGRLLLAQDALEAYGVTPFGQAVTWVGQAAVQSGRYSIEQYNYVDSGYLQILFQFGYVSLMVVCMAYVLVAINASKEPNGIAIEIWVIAIAIECLIYPNLLLLAYNSVLLLAFDSGMRSINGQ